MKERNNKLFLRAFLVVCLSGLVIAGLILKQSGESNSSEQTSTQTQELPGAEKVSPGPESIAETTPSEEQSEAREIPGIVRIMSEGTHHERQMAIRALEENITRDEIETLLDYLRSPGGSGMDTPQSVRTEAAIKNNVINLLTRLEPPLPELGGALISIYEDPEQHVVLRDYSIQYLAFWHGELSERLDGPSAVDSRELLRIEQTLWKALQETESSIAGTALLGLTSVADNTQGFDVERLQNSALELAASEDVGEMARLTALQVCAQLETVEALPAATELARSGNSLALRRSAIAALGQLGGSDELAVLQTILNDPDPVLHPAAEAAMRRIQDRKTDA